MMAGQHNAAYHNGGSSNSSSKTVKRWVAVVLVTITVFCSIRQLCEESIVVRATLRRAGGSSSHRRQQVVVGVDVVPSQMEEQLAAQQTSEVASTSSAQRQQNHQQRARPPYAYAFVVGGCDPTNQTHPTYRNYLYDILINAKVLRESGSTADIVVFLQFTYQSAATTLPPHETAWLRAYNVRIFYIPPSQGATFYSITLDKFRILGLTEYARVLFLDSDIMLLSNLDYLFDLSMRGVLKENVLLAGTLEPANAGLFMLAPYPEALADIDGIILRKERYGREHVGRRPWFDPAWGWGHEMKPPDHWRSHSSMGFNYTFHGSQAEQGLLYYYAKYFRRSASIIFGETVDQITMDETGRVDLGINVRGLFKRYASQNKYPSRLIRNCYKWSGSRQYCDPPFCHFYHFTSDSKPWLTGPPPDHDFIENPTRTIEHFWYFMLAQLNVDLKMNLIWYPWTNTNPPPLGYYHSPIQVEKRGNVSFARDRAIEYGDEDEDANETRSTSLRVGSTTIKTAAIS